MASTKKTVVKKVGFARLTKAERAAVASKGGLTRVANARAKAAAEVKAIKKTAAKKVVKKVAKK